MRRAAIPPRLHAPPSWSHRPSRLFGRDAIWLGSSRALIGERQPHVAVLAPRSGNHARGRSDQRDEAVKRKVLGIAVWFALSQLTLPQAKEMKSEIVRALGWELDPYANSTTPSVSCNYAFRGRWCLTTSNPSGPGAGRARGCLKGSAKSSTASRSWRRCAERYADAPLDPDTPRSTGLRRFTQPVS